MRSTLPHHMRLSLLAAQVVGAATLIRSIAYDRWITVLASVLLIMGVIAARRGRTWGVGLALASAAAFPVAWAIGIAPAWFCLVGIAGALPFALASRAFARFDKHATVLLAVLAAAGGTLGAYIWKHIAFSVFAAFPFLMPSADAEHGVLIGTLVAVATAVALSRAGRRGDAGALEDGHHHAHVRIAERLNTETHAQAQALDAADEEEMEAMLRPASSRRAQHRLH